MQRILHSNKKRKNSTLLKLLFLLSCIFIIYLAFFRLGSAPLENWDEAWYADVTRNMLQTKEFFVLYWNHAVWFDKPPMFMWFAAFFSSIFGLSEFSLRFTSALSGVIITVLVIRFAYKHYGLVAAYFSFINLALNNIFVWRMRSGNIDLLVTLFVFLVFLLQMSKYKYRYPLIGFIFGCIFLTKASLVFFPLTIFVLAEILFERHTFKINYKRYGLLVIIALSLVVGWLVIGSWKAGPKLYEYFLFKSDQGVSKINLFAFNKDYILFTYYALQRRFFFVFIVGILFALRYIKDKKVLLILLYGTALLLQLSFTERSNNWYLIPSMPFWSLLIGFGVYHSLKLFRNNIILSILIVSIGTILAYRTYTINIIPILYTAANISQMQSSKEVYRLSKEGDTVIRLDQLYPTTVFYSQRRVLASPDGGFGTSGYIISREDVAKKIKRKERVWVVGKNADVQTLKEQLDGVGMKEIKVNKEEIILQIL